MNNGKAKYKFYKGESRNPFIQEGQNPLDRNNPKAMFWHYEEQFENTPVGNRFQYEAYIYDIVIGNKMSGGNPDKIKKFTDLYKNS